MTEHDEFKEFEPANDAERHALERRWAGGNLATTLRIMIS